MTEEEVSKQLLQMNNDLYYKKLIIDLEKVFENLTIIFQNVITNSSNELYKHAYAILHDDGKMIDSVSLKKLGDDFFNKLKESIVVLLEKNKGILSKYINENNQEEYIKNIEVLSSEMMSSIDNLYRNSEGSLIDSISMGYQEFTRKRIESLVKELIYQHFINSLMSTSNDMNKLLMNKYQSNNTYLENMNNKTVAM